jgi:hypothetical protein
VHEWYEVLGREQEVDGQGPMWQSILAELQNFIPLVHNLAPYKGMEPGRMHGDMCFSSFQDLNLAQ